MIDRYRVVLAGIGMTALAAALYWLSNREFEAGRGDFFHLADAFLQGRTWLDFRPGPWDVIAIEDRYYVPFAPFPALALMPIVAVIGGMTADQLESGINALLAASTTALCWVLLGRLGVARGVDRYWITMLFAFGTAIWWVTTRGGVWHTGHLIATILTLGCLIELWGRQRALLVGLLAGAAFLTRPPLAFAIPFYALMLDPARGAALAAVPGAYVASTLERWPLRRWAQLALGVLPALAFFFWYNLARFGDPLESGYALAALPEWLAARREIGLFSLAHVPMNLDLLLLKLPRFIEEPPFFRPDGHGLSVLFTSPALLLALWAPWRSSRSLLLAAAAVAVLVPTLLYYGGGWLQYGYRYFLDSIPFVVALGGLAVARGVEIDTGWKLLIAWSVAINALGVYWASRI